MCAVLMSLLLFANSVQLLKAFVPDLTQVGGQSRLFTGLTCM
jgi:hypothetical protein